MGSDNVARGRKTPGDKLELVKSIAYLNPELNSKEIAAAADMPERTVRDIVSQFKNDDDFAEYRLNKKKELIARSLDIAAAYTLHMMDPAVIDKAGARDSAIVAGTMIDKSQLLAGEATVISERRESTPELVQEMESKLVKLKQMTGT